MASILKLFTDSIRSYLGDRAAIYAAGLAYYAVFAIAPLLILLGLIAGFFIGQSRAITEIMETVQYIVGPELAGYLAQIVQTLSTRTFGPGSVIVALVGLVLSGAGIFGQLDAAINDLWGIVTQRPQGLRDRLLLLRRKLAPFAMVFFLGLLLSASIALEATLVTLAARIAPILPGLSSHLTQLNWLLVPILSFLTFGAIFKWLPDANSRWRDIAVGSLITTTLFLIGRSGMELYLRRDDRASLFGAASSLIVLLIWVDVSAHILLFGAEFTKLYADRYGQPIEPRRLAAFVDGAALSQSKAKHDNDKDDAAPSPANSDARNEKTPD